MPAPKPAFMVAYGYLAHGIRFFGPFATEKAATDWAKMHYSDDDSDFEVIQMVTPEMVAAQVKAGDFTYAPRLEVFRDRAVQRLTPT